MNTKGRDELYKNEFFVAHLSNFPVNPGHIELYPRRHFAEFIELNKEEASILPDTINNVWRELKQYDFRKYYSEKIKRIDNKAIDYYGQRMLELDYIDKHPDGYNLGVNNGLSAGQTVMHLHLHIIPRFSGDLVDSTGGVRNLMNDLGNYMKHINN